MKPQVLTVALSAALAALAAPAVAAPAEQWRPVDQAVEDVTPLGTSLRRMEPGIGLIGQSTAVYTPVTPHDAGTPGAPGAPGTPGVATYTDGRVYYRVGRGYRARVNRLDYLVGIGEREAAMNVTPQRGQAYLDVIPPDTVFELSPDPRVVPVHAPPPYEDDAWRHDTPDPRVNARIDARVSAEVPPPQPRQSEVGSTPKTPRAQRER